jgi:hypothetical protein
VNRLSGQPGPFARDVHRMCLGVAHLGLNVPQPVFSLKTAVNNVSRMRMGSGFRCWQWQIGASCEWQWISVECRLPWLSRPPHERRTGSCTADRFE